MILTAQPAALSLAIRCRSVAAEAPGPSTPTHQARKVFVVHGHDGAALQTVARFLEQLGLEPIILSEQPDAGRTIIEKFEAYASQVSFAVVLLTPDDLGGPAAALGNEHNMIFALPLGVA